MAGDRAERDATQDALMKFISEASRLDAGEAACREVFGISLGGIAGEFLGHGDWTPRPTEWVPPENEPGTYPATG